MTLTLFQHTNFGLFQSQINFFKSKSTCLSSFQFVIFLLKLFYISDCEDRANFCSEWKKKGYCKTNSKHYPYMEEQCQQTCGVCKLCPVPTPKNTALPPPPTTPLTCSPSGSFISFLFSQDLLFLLRF